MIVIALLTGCRQAPHPTAAEGLAPATQGSADWQAQARAAFERGVDCLVRSQNKDGSWGHFAAARPLETGLENSMAFEAYHATTTALCAMASKQASIRDDDVPIPAASAAHPVEEVAFLRAVDDLLQARTAFRTPGDVLYDNWAHPYVTYALSILARDPRLAIRRARFEDVVKREIDRLELQQGADGGITFPRRLLRDGLRAVERLRVGNGAYPYGNMTLVDGQDSGDSWLDDPRYQFGQPYGAAFALLAHDVCLREAE